MKKAVKRAKSKTKTKTKSKTKSKTAKSSSKRAAAKSKTKKTAKAKTACRLVTGSLWATARGQMIPSERSQIARDHRPAPSDHQIEMIEDRGEIIGLLDDSAAVRRRVVGASRVAVVPCHRPHGQPHDIAVGLGVVE